MAVRVSPRDQMPGIVESGHTARGWPAGRVDAIGRKFEASMPEPKLRDYAPTSAAQ
ncbi:unnamed protein product [marine sediment metagenome]|uniref:Uncharacterized protein n=1 Tax=marine sediment metagenome TaxID=412755 RepID=X0WMY6_9ZZZZ